MVSLLLIQPSQKHKVIIDNISNHLQLIREKLDLYSSNYESIILVGDFFVKAAI